MPPLPSPPTGRTTPPPTHAVAGCSPRSPRPGWWLLAGLCALAAGLVRRRPAALEATAAVPAFTLLLPVAIGLARRRIGTAVAVVLAAALGSGWFGGYALTIWHYGI